MMACTHCLILDEVNPDDPITLSDKELLCRKHLLISLSVPYGQTEDQLKERVRRYKGPLANLLP